MSIKDDLLISADLRQPVLGAGSVSRKSKGGQ